MKELIDLQRALHVPKDQKQQHYNYRTVDSILKAVKKLAPDNVYFLLTDEVVCIGNGNYTKATATIYNGKDSISCSAYAREPDKLGSQSLPQISGSCSTYSRKNALAGLLGLDDNKDPDNKEKASNIQKSKLKDCIAKLKPTFPSHAEGIEKELAFELSYDRAQELIDKTSEKLGVKI